MMDEMDMDAPPRKSESPKDISFKESFRRAKDAGLKSFSFGGKKYTTDMAAAKATPKAAVMDKPAPAKTAPAASEQDNEVPRPPSEGRYKQDTYETPMKSAVRKMAPEVMDNLGKIVGGLGAGYGAFKGGSKLIDAARAADKGRATAALARGNAGLAERMKGIVSGAEDAVAARAAAKAARQPYNQATEERLTGLAMNPRRANIPLGSGSGANAPTSASRTRFNEDDVGVEFRKGGKAKCYAKGGSVGSASRRADGCATKGKTKGRIY